MTIRHLDRAFSPGSVAVIGASNRPGRVGSLVLANVVDDGYKGAVYPVNPKYPQLSGQPCYPRVADLPAVPDLCVIATPPQTVPGLIEEIGAFGCRAALVLTAGINAEDRQLMLTAAGRHGLRIIGPNSIGMLAPRIHLNASFTHIGARAGSLGLLSQSGAIVSSIIDWAEAQRVGFSQIVSMGDMADVDVGDCLNMLATDPATTAILLYLESIPMARKFLSAARAASRIKPVIAVKPGRHTEAARAAQTHTGALAGADDVVEAALRRAGIIRVNDLEDLFAAAGITARFKSLEQGRVAIVTNGGGAGVLAVDHLLDRGAQLATLSPATMSQLDALLPPAWSRANPIDIIGDAPPGRYVGAIEAAAADPGVDLLLAMNCPTALAPPVDSARAIAARCTDGLINGKPVVATWLGAFAARKAREELNAKGIASFDTPSDAADAIGLLLRRRQLLTQLQRVPGTFETLHVDSLAAGKVIRAAADAGRTMLTEPEAKAVLAAYGIAVPRTLMVRTRDEVRAAAAELLSKGGRVAVKMVSETQTHKSDLGGVVLDLGSAEAAEQAARDITGRLASRGLEAALNGFAIQEMVVRPDAQELLIGVASDAVFGPVLVFGAGGTAVEVLRDTTMELLPVDDVLADTMIARTRVSGLLAGYRNTPAADRPGIIKALKAVSQLLIDMPQVTALDINPLLADHQGVIALDARIEIDPARVGLTAPNPALTIRPYPSEWKTSLLLDEGQQIDVRPIRPVDAALYDDFIAHMTPEDLRLRFLAPTRALSADTLLRLTQLDYDRDIAFVALTQTGALAGVVRYASDPDRRNAEFSVIVRSDLQHKGLGRGLLRYLIDYARAQRVARLTGLVLRHNHAMLGLARALGFSVKTETGQDGIVTVALDLT